jgi:hypothetical protein
MFTEIELFDSPDLTALDVCLWGWMNREVYKSKLETRDESLARILDAAARVTVREDELRRRKCDLRGRVAKCFEVGGGIFENLL